jgi:hypothetical protein
MQDHLANVARKGHFWITWKAYFVKVQYICRCVLRCRDFPDNVCLSHAFVHVVVCMGVQHTWAKSHDEPRARSERPKTWASARQLRKRGCVWKIGGASQKSHMICTIAHIQHSCNQCTPLGVVDRLSEGALSLRVSSKVAPGTDILAWPRHLEFTRPNCTVCVEQNHRWTKYSTSCKQRPWCGKHTIVCVPVPDDANQLGRKILANRQAGLK